MGRPTKYVIGREYNGWLLLARHVQKKGCYARMVYTVKCCTCSAVKDIFHFRKMCDCEKPTAASRLAGAKGAVRRMLSKGAKRSDVARKFGVNKAAVQRFCDAHNIPYPHQGRLTVDVINKLTAEGLTLTQIANKLKYNLSYVWKFCKTHNTKYIAGRGGRHLRFNDGDAERLRCSWAKHKDYKKVAEEMDCSVTAARKYLRQFDIVPKFRKYRKCTAPAPY